MLNIRFLCLLGGTAALMQKGINNFKLCLIRKLLYLFMSNLSLAFPWRVGNTVSMIPCHYWLLFLSENILSEISKEKELSAKLEAASTGAGCLPAAFVTIMSSVVKISVIFMSPALSSIHFFTARTNSQTWVSSFQLSLQISPLNIFFPKRLSTLNSLFR